MLGVSLLGLGSPGQIAIEVACSSLFYMRIPALTGVILAGLEERMADAPPITPAQQGLGDMDPEEFRRAAHRVADQVADYLERLTSYRVLPDLEPGSIRASLPASPPAEPEPLAAILEDYARL